MRGGWRKTVILPHSTSPLPNLSYTTLITGFTPPISSAWSTAVGDLGDEVAVVGRNKQGPWGQWNVAPPQLKGSFKAAESFWGRNLEVRCASPEKFGNGRTPERNVDWDSGPTIPRS